MPSVGGALAVYTERQQNTGVAHCFPMKVEMSRVKGHPSLLDQMSDEWSMVEDMRFDEKDFKAGPKLRPKNVLGRRENMSVLFICDKTGDEFEMMLGYCDACLSFSFLLRLLFFTLALICRQRIGNTPNKLHISLDYIFLFL
jgi:hypothetical protein